MMRQTILMLGLLTLCSCSSEGLPSGFGVNLIMRLGPGLRPNLSSVGLSVSGAETYQTTLAATAFDRDEARIRYIPGAQSGQLTFDAVARSAAGDLGHGGVTVQLVSGQAVTSTINISSGAIPPDMAMPNTDMPDTDGIVTDPDLLPPPDLNLNCTFGQANGACVFPPHATEAALVSCKTNMGAPRLAPPVGGSARIAKVGAGYKIVCIPHCGEVAVTEILPQETIFQAASTPLIEFFCLAEINIPAGVTLRGGEDISGSFVSDVTHDRAVTIMSKAAGTIAGVLDFDGTGKYPDPYGGLGGAGGYRGGNRLSNKGNPGGGPCAGGGGNTVGTAPAVGSGGGGGGNGTAGGLGGAGGSGAIAGTAGCVRSTAVLEGGSGGGSGGVGTIYCIPSTGCTPFASNHSAAGGGGAVAIVSPAELTVTGQIQANGGVSKPVASNTSYNYAALGGGGSGAGGMIVLAAPTVTISGAGKLNANGGNGGSVEAAAGGPGATGAGSAGNGTAGPNASTGGTGGGGGGGFIRIYAAGGGAACATAASPTTACSVGPLPTTPGL